jgi:hypothetical protein
MRHRRDDAGRPLDTGALGLSPTVWLFDLPRDCGDAAAMVLASIQSEHHVATPAGRSWTSPGASLTPGVGTRDHERR